MTIAAVRKKFEDELAGIAGKIAKLQERAELLRTLLAELDRAAPAPKASKPVKKKAGRRARKPKTGTTVKNAILMSVAQAPRPLTAGEILLAAEKLSGGAVSSIRTQINALAKAGDLEKVPHEGRGYKYKPGASKAPKK